MASASNRSLINALQLSGGALTGQLTVATSNNTAPLVVTSTALCSNLNAQLLAGQDSNFYVAPAAFGSNAGAFGSNAGAFGSNAGAFGSNAGAFGSNAGAFGSNAGAFGSNLSPAVAFASNLTTGVAFASNSGAFGSNAGAFASNAVRGALSNSGVSASNVLASNVHVQGGRLGVGTIAPVTAAHVIGNVTVHPTANASVGCNTCISINAHGTGDGSPMTLELGWTSNAGNNNFNMLSYLQSKGLNVSTAAPPLAFMVGSNNERMRLTSAGLGIGTSGPSAPLHVAASNANADGLSLRVSGNAAASNLALSAQLTSTAAPGVAPLAVQSTTLCSNLNAQLLAGQNSNFYVAPAAFASNAGAFASNAAVHCSNAGPIAFGVARALEVTQHPPAMTEGVGSVTSPNPPFMGTYIASSSYSNSAFASRAFDRTASVWETLNGGYTLTTGSWSNTVASTTVVSGSNVDGHFVQLQLPTSVPLNRVFLTTDVQLSNEKSPRDIVVAGSLDGTTWSWIDAFANIPYIQSNVYTALPINSNATAYSHYRMIPTRTWGSRNVSILNMYYTSEWGVAQFASNAGAFGSNAATAALAALSNGGMSTSNLVVASNVRALTAVLTNGNGAWPSASSTAQIMMGWSGGSSNNHNIRTRHQAIAANSNENAIELFVWRPGQATSALGDQHVLTASAGGVGVFTSNPRYPLDVSGVSRAGRLVNATFVKTLGTTLGDGVNICAVTSADAAAFAFTLQVVHGAAGNNNVKVYDVVSLYNATINGWRALRPRSLTDAVNGNDFEVEINHGTAGSMTLRLRRSAVGTSISGANITCTLQLTENASETVTVSDSATTYTALAAPSATHPSSLMTTGRGLVTVGDRPTTSYQGSLLNVAVSNATGAVQMVLNNQASSGRAGLYLNHMSHGTLITQDGSNLSMYGTPGRQNWLCGDGWEWIREGVGSRMRLTADGNLGVQTFNPTAPLHVAASNASGVSILASHDIVAFSDARLKHDVRPIEGATERLAGVRGCTFAREPTAGAHRYAGLIAQEVQAALPEVVQTDPESGMLSVAYGNFTALLVQAVNELARRVAALERVYP